MVRNWVIKMTEQSKFGKKFIDRFTEISIKIGNQIYLKSLRDAFAMIMPLFILAGIGVLINNVIFTLFFKGAILANFQTFGNYLVNGTLNIAGLLIAPVLVTVYQEIVIMLIN